MRIVVTGAEGMLGKDVVPVLASAGNDVLGVSRVECDIADTVAVDKMVRRFQPELIVNCAAFPDVDKCELDPVRAQAVNETGPGILARAAERNNARLFHISTDYVFDGTKVSPYVESDPVNPLSTYGRSKRAGELAVIGMGSGVRHLVIRTSWLFGFGKDNFIEKILKDIDLGAPLKAVSDQNSCPTWTLHLAQIIAELARLDITGILHLAGSGFCTRQEMASYIVLKVGKTSPVEGITRAEFSPMAKRPLFSAIVSERLLKFHLSPLPHWRDAISEYLTIRNGNRLAKA